MRFRPEQHLRRPGDFRAVRELGRRIDCGAFTVWHFRRPEVDGQPALSRVGVIASIAAVGAATRRNRAKRRMRELFRENQALIPSGTDVLLVARAAVNQLDYRILGQRFTEACRKFTPMSHA